MQKKIEDLEKRILKMEEKHEVEIANIKINYIASLLILIIYLLVKDMSPIETKYITITPTISIVFSALIIYGFFLKENIIYAKYFVKRILFKIK